VLQQGQTFLFISWLIISWLRDETFRVLVAPLAKRPGDEPGQGPAILRDVTRDPNPAKRPRTAHGGAVRGAFSAGSVRFEKVMKLEKRRGVRAAYSLGCIMSNIVQRQSFDADYVQRLINSDSATEDAFVAYFGELLSIKLRSRLRSPELIQDVTQETFLRVLKPLRQSGIETPEALGAFVNSVCNNVLFEAYRSQRRATDPLVDYASDDATADTTILEEEERTQVRSVLSELPEKDRKILRWLFFDERDKGEVCRVLQVDREYLRVLLHRAKQRFRTDYLRRIATKPDRATPMG
jgi:RNA polymerase sigma-70 factor, ECF subfamily